MDIVAETTQYFHKSTRAEAVQLLVQGPFVNIRLCTAASSYKVWSQLALFYSANRISSISIVLVHKCLPALTVVRPQDPGAHSGHIPHSHCLHKAWYIQMPATYSHRTVSPLPSCPPSPPATLSTQNPGYQGEGGLPEGVSTAARNSFCRSDQLPSCGVGAVAAAGLWLQVDALPCSGLQLSFHYLMQVVAAIHCRPPAGGMRRVPPKSRCAAGSDACRVTVSLPDTLSTSMNQ